MCISELKGDTVPIKLWLPAHEGESQALDQLKNIAALPWVFHHVAVMPDMHFGKGATVGSVIAMKDAVSPAAVGVDIGCGMAALRTSLTQEQLPDSLAEIRRTVERRIPVGFNKHSEPVLDVSTQTLWHSFGDLDRGVRQLKERAMCQIGTLGGGNHFIELCIDEAGFVWVMLHSGSRNIGKTLADIHIKRAQALTHNEHLPDKDLAVFLAGTPEMKAYRHDLMWAQAYALENRDTMLRLYAGILQQLLPPFNITDTVKCHHNYVSEEVHYGEEVIVTRKGAINAAQGVRGIIPGSMGTKSYIVSGRGNSESFNSASHGAGRRMSRGQAKRTFTAEDLATQTDGVECRKDTGVLDEIPGAYKDIDHVMENQRDLVTIEHELKAVMCIKG